MATSSSILQSFLRDSLKEKRNIVDLSFDELLAYSRARCGLIEIKPDLVDFDDVDFNTLKDLIKDDHAVVLQNETLFYVDLKKQKISLLKEPQEPETDARKNTPEYTEYLKSPEYRQYLRDQTHYNRLINSASEAYKRIGGKELDYIRSATGRAFASRRSDDFLPSLEFYLGILDNADPVLFKYLSPAQKEQLIFDLRITALLLAAQQKHEIDYKKTENKNKYDQHLSRCLRFLKEFDPVYQERLKKSPELAEVSDAQPLKYMGIPVGQLLAENIADLSSGTTKTIRKYMDALNEKRLYWVWGSSLIKTLISLVPEDKFYQKQAAGTIKMPDPYTGNLSWILYYARFFMNLALLLRHTIRGPWMSQEEINTPWQERFLTQWSNRKFILLNDSIWGTANLACFFWLTGKSVLGTAGDAVTLALLAFDTLISIWDFAEQSTKHTKAMQQYEEDLQRLTRQLHQLQNKGVLQEDEQKAKRQLEMQISTLRREKLQCEKDWQLQKASLIVNIAYAVGLMAAFFVLTMPFMPIAAPALATMGIVGAVLCFALTVIYNAAKGGLELYKTYKTIQDQKQDAEDKIEGLIKLLKNKNDLEADERKLLYLEIRKCQAETEYQKQTMIYQSVNLARNIFIQALVPAVVFASLMFVPLGIGIAVLVAAVALAIASQLLVDGWFKPKEKKEWEFDETEYNQFCTEILTPKPQKTEHSGLLSWWGKKSDEKERLLENRDDQSDIPDNFIPTK
ncbi:hypothetical protein OQJ18_11715 [Fluoribacter dumoffii]|uniref:hypothetical protein n=1 Tax=Fluoribacter dumoffii TaxID=463 RepID=UPI00224476E8|nr:hypothetical protein [Fluoribacter dumoffii]MCW8417240.1 hypothetical protein [Fluoribacter dumoffii]MCW8454919.1 hypothetical protein [Fluoribacter dumoffii]MCW8461004.1 hypothetical protein [Fluoribacter dumoffii]MCW8484445.1 hypothetical protein [Fluoribacter dumoffii]